MKNIQTLGLVACVLIVASSTTVWSQTRQSASAPAGAMSASVTAASEAAPSTESTGNRALRRKVYSAIVKNKEISAGNISVIAKSGAVTLNGTVTDATQIDKVAEIAKGVPGVTSVTNKLTVQKPLGGM